VGGIAQTSAHEVPTPQGVIIEKPRAGERTRTADPLFTRQALYQLSYSGGEAEFSRAHRSQRPTTNTERRSAERASIRARAAATASAFLWMERALPVACRHYAPLPAGRC
jgi:hypothetical protein